MQLYKKILCPVDFSEFSALALRYAAALAKKTDALLLVHHSLPDLSQALGYLEPAAISTARDAMQSNTDSRLRCKPSHNFVEKDSNDPIRINRIICALDLEPNNIAIAERALAIARSYQSTIFFLHVAPEKEGLVDLDEEDKSVEIMKDLVANAPEDWCTIHYLLRTGDPAREIMSALTDSNADLLVMGHHTRKPIEEVFLGSVAKKLVTDSPCPVLVVRTVHDAVTHDVVLI